MRVREPVLVRNYWATKPNHSLVAVFGTPANPIRIQGPLAFLNRVPAMAAVIAPASSHDFLRVLCVEVVDDLG